MDKNTNIVVTLIVIAVAIGAAYMIFTAAPDTGPLPPNGNGDTTTDAGEFAKPTTDTIHRIPAALSYTEGRYRISGTIDKPTPCHRVASSVTKNAERATVRFTMTSEAEACAQVITPESLTVSFTGAPGLVIHASVNGQPAAFVAN